MLPDEQQPSSGTRCLALINTNQTDLQAANPLAPDHLPNAVLESLSF